MEDSDSEFNLEKKKQSLKIKVSPQRCTDNHADTHFD